MRAWIAVMMFTACWTSYTCRLQMSILAVPMIVQTPKDERFAAIEPATRSMSDGGPHKPHLWLNPEDMIDEILSRNEIGRQFGRRSKRQDEVAAGEDEETEKALERDTFDLWSGEPFNWEPHIRGQLLAAYAYGNVPGNLLGGILAMKFGARATVMWTALVAVFVSMVSPVLANIHWLALFGSRVLVGLAGGVVFPSCHTLVAKWSPPDEKSRFVWSLLGGTFGTVFTYPAVAALAQHVTWEAGWYLPSLVMFVWLIFWWLLVYDSPGEHPGITDAEKNYIVASQGSTVRADKPALKDTPLKAIFTSIPFLSLVVCHFGNLFLLFFYQNSILLYLTLALGLQITKGGFLAGLPWLARMSFGFFFSWIGDIIKRKQVVSLTTFRKGATVFSHFIPGVFLVMVGYVGKSFMLANVFLFFALGFNGAASIANLSNNQDLSPNYAGLLYGIMNTVGTTSGMIIPPMVEAIAGAHGNTVEQWQTIFWIGAAVCISSMIVFIIGGSAEIQPWNEGRQRGGGDSTKV
ncbi:hypothetical protein QAD02_017472 [Eretmocerus hayati]|uniref:Uncharacterized protein n=1 Tax=Eretmocerus hayati TaxID=131215 RepID=A0ACC2PE10_9HYME|nr:hypothetical protein QAD02_017472 [Eretmocerus hayati]